MANDASHALLCLIEGESAVFRVEPAGNKNIVVLKDLIKEKNSNLLQGVDASSLTLWKVRMTITSDSTINSPAG
jgi:hypothetical protein